MRKTVVGMVDSYGTAERIVEDLELHGIVGNEVEVVSGADEEVLGPVAPSGDPPQEGFADRIRRLFRSLTHSEKRQVHDYYAEDPEFYASQVRQGRAMVIVRAPDVLEADRAAEILRRHGAYDPKGGDGPRIFWENDQPESTPPPNEGQKEETIGNDALTTGGTRADLEGRGTQIRKATEF
jgi:hypothetical protein